jgi:hypothetical protein
MLPGSYVFVLLLAIIVELLTARTMGFGKLHQAKSIALINTITNPIVNYIVLVNSYFLFINS